MELKELEAFVAVVRHRSFSRASEALYFSQSTVSAHIASLENSLGAQLLVRTTKKLSLTAAGREFYTYAHNILTLRDQALQNIGRGDRDARSSIHILASTLPAQHLLPEMIAGFRQKWPNVVFHIDQADSREVLDTMTEFRYDFGFVGTAPTDRRFTHCPIYLDRMLLALPGDMTFNGDAIRRDFASFVRKHPFIMRERGSGTRAEIEALLERLGVTPSELQIPAYFSDTHSILLAVSRGLGISLVSAVSAAMHVAAGAVAAVDMHDPLFIRQIYLFYNRELRLPPVQQAFAEHVQSFYAH